MRRDVLQLVHSRLELTCIIANTLYANEETLRPQHIRDVLVPKFYSPLYKFYSILPHRLKHRR